MVHKKILVTDPPILQFIGAGAVFPVVKQPGREAGRSPPSLLQIKNEWMYSALPHMPLWRAQG